MSILRTYRPSLVVAPSARITQEPSMAGSISCRCSNLTANSMIFKTNMHSAPPHIRSVFRVAMPSAAAPTHATPPHSSRRPEPCTSVYIMKSSKHKKQIKKKYNGGCSSSKLIYSRSCEDEGCSILPGRRRISLSFLLVGSAMRRCLGRIIPRNLAAPSA